MLLNRSNSALQVDLNNESCPQTVEVGVSHGDSNRVTQTASDDIDVAQSGNKKEQGTRPGQNRPPEFLKTRTPSIHLQIDGVVRGSSSMPNQKQAVTTQRESCAWQIDRTDSGPRFVTNSERSRNSHLCSLHKCSMNYRSPVYRTKQKYCNMVFSVNTAS